MQHPTSSELITVSHAARFLERSEASIRSMTRRGELPCVRLSSGARVFELHTLERVREQLKNHAA